MRSSPGIAPILATLLGGSPPVRLAAYDGSTAGDVGAAAAVVVRTPDAVARIVAAPGELGFARAYVAGDVDLEGDIFEVLRIVDSVREKRAVFTLRARSPTSGTLSTKRCHRCLPLALRSHATKPQIDRPIITSSSRKWLRSRSDVPINIRVLIGSVRFCAWNILVTSGITATIRIDRITVPITAMMIGYIMALWTFDLSFCDESRKSARRVRTSSRLPATSPARTIDT